ncbi:MAG TPA: hypothetical protein VEY89_02570 [Candidatus Dormibacteraeota bacterium]|nr:hypothetical protein [Candidatus Dormibacteraeota bacterium]
MRFGLAAAFAATFAAAALIIYVAIGSRHSASEPAAHAAMTNTATGAANVAASGNAAKSMDSEVAALETRLSRDGGSDDDWNLLAKAYDFLGRPDDAKRARAHLAKPGAAPLSAGALAAAASATTISPATGGATRAAPAPAAPALAELQQRVKVNAKDAAAWLGLADAYRAARDNAQARDAYVKVDALKGMTAQSWADYADVLAALAGGSLAGPAGNAIDRALALDAANPKALWLKASQAHEQQRYAEALTWWRKLRAALPPDSPDARIIDNNIAEDSSLGGLPAPTAPASAAAGAPGAEVTGTVSLDSRFAGRVQGDAVLFISAKAADSPGPPLAVMRTTTTAWPVAFHLDDSMAMIPSRRLSQFDKVVVEARISRSGQATPASGDLYVTSPVLHPDSSKKLALVINREIS